MNKEIETHPLFNIIIHSMVYNCSAPDDVSIHVHCLAPVYILYNGSLITRCDDSLYGFSTWKYYEFLYCSMDSCTDRFLNGSSYAIYNPLFF